MDNRIVKTIYTEYFQMIDSYFGGIAHHLGGSEDSHFDLGYDLSEYPLIADLMVDSIYDLQESIFSFWEKNREIVFKHIENIDKLKCLYSGSITPRILERFIKKTSLYVDTTIIADPILNIVEMKHKIITDKNYYLKVLITNVFNIWRLKDFILSGIDADILYILPINIFLLEQNKIDYMYKEAQEKFLKYYNSIFNNKATSEPDAIEMATRFVTPKEIITEFSDLNLMPTVFKNENTLGEFLEGFQTSRKSLALPNKSAGFDFALYLKSQFIRTQEHKYFCTLLSAEPIYDNDLPWFFFNLGITGIGIDGGIINSLHQDRLNWISKIPIEALKVLRMENKMDYMRNVLRTSITDIKVNKDKDLLKISEMVEKNITEAFKRQDAEIKSLEKQVKEITKKEIPIVVTGSILGFIPYIGSAISLALSGRDVTKLLSEKKELDTQINEKQSNIINILLKSKEENDGI